MNKKSTKRALLTSMLMLLISCSMFVGSTFAWFTDTVASKNNIITSGNLDVVLEYKTAWEDDWAPVDETVAVFNENALYEPGYTEVVFLRVSNAGSLALKYNLDVNVYTETTSTSVEGNEFKLSDYLQVGAYVQDEYSSGFNYADLLMPTMFADRASALSNVTSLSKLSADWIAVKDAPVLPGDDTAQVVALVLTMPTEVGNEANHDTAYAAPTIELGIALTAAQYTHEADSFDNQYDANAEYGEIAQASYPRAKVTGMGNNYTVNVYNEGPKVLNTAYKFEPTETLAEAQASDFRYWNADFVVVADEDVAANSLALAGYYSAWCDALVDGDWIAIEADTDIAAGQEVRLVKDGVGAIVNYEELCEYGNDGKGFQCGLINYSDDNVGTTITVELRMYETYSAEEANELFGYYSTNIETGFYIVAGTFSYTIK